LKQLLPYQIFLFLIFLAPLCVVAQNEHNWRTVTDALMSEADSLALKSQVTFHLEKLLKADQSYKETWHYTEKKGKVIFFQIHYMIESTEFTESYYLNSDGKLICMEQVQAPFAHTYVDEVIRGERFFLVENAIKEHVTFGKQKFDTKNFPDASIDCLTRFDKRLEELVKNKDELNSLQHKNN
jgi:hypothetical protein